MADTSERIIILSAVLLGIIILLPNSGLMRPRGTVFDIEVEITTSRDSYTLGESFTATLHLVNNGSKDVWMYPIYELPFLGNSVNDPEPNTGVILLDYPQGHKIHVPPKSKIQLFERDFKSQYSGEFFISCFGVNKTVQILSQIAVRVQLDAHSYTDKSPILSITNYGSNIVTYGSYYKFERREGDNWVEVSPFPSNMAWTAEARIVRPGETKRQSIKIEGLELGEYRLTKTVRDEDIWKEATFIIEFEIEQ